MTTHLLHPDRIATLLYPDMDILHVGYYYDKKDAERVVIDQESLQAIYKNFQDHDVGYAFVKSVSALKLENLSRNYR